MAILCEVSLNYPNVPVQMPGRGLVLADSEYPCMIITETIVSKCTLYYLSKPLSRVVLVVLR